jgi:hypothetical protein
MNRSGGERVKERIKRQQTQQEEEEMRNWQTERERERDKKIVRALGMKLKRMTMWKRSATAN